MTAQQLLFPEFDKPNRKNGRNETHWVNLKTKNEKLFTYKIFNDNKS